MDKTKASGAATGGQRIDSDDRGSETAQTDSQHAQVRRRALLRAGGSAALGALALDALAAQPTLGQSAGAIETLWPPLVGTWLMELHLNIPGVGSGTSEMAMWFLPGGMALATEVWGTPDLYGNPTLQLGAHPGAWTLVDPGQRSYRYRMSPMYYYPTAQSPFQPNGAVARIHTSTVDLLLSADANSFVSTGEQAVAYWYDVNGALIVPPSPQNLGQVSKVAGRRITMDFVPPSRFPFWSGS